MPQNLRGDVRTFRSELSEWDPNKEQWQEPSRVILQQFRADGKVSETVDRFSNGSISRSTHIYDDAGRLSESQFRLDEGPISRTIHHYDDLGRLVKAISIDEDGIQHEAAVWTYDTGGRKTKVESVQMPQPRMPGGTMFGVEGTEQAYAAEGVATIETLYDEREQSLGAVFRDARGQPTLRVMFIRDEAGRVVEEEAQLESSPPFSLENQLVNAPAEVTTAAKALLEQLFGPRTIMSRTTYRYDAGGRRIERSGSRFKMVEERTTWEYADHDEPVREISEYSARDMNINQSGKHQPTKERSSQHELRFDYKFDAKGNWTERMVSLRYGANPDFQRSNVERREITYWT